MWCRYQQRLVLLCVAIACSPHAIEARKHLTRRLSSSTYLIEDDANLFTWSVMSGYDQGIASKRVVLYVQGTDFEVNGKFSGDSTPRLNGVGIFNSNGTEFVKVITADTLGSVQLIINRRIVDVSQRTTVTTPKTSMIVSIVPASNEAFASISITSTLGYAVSISSDGVDALYLSVQGPPCDGNTHGFLGDFGCSKEVLPPDYQIPYVPILRSLYTNGGGSGGGGDNGGNR